MMLACTVFLRGLSMLIVSVFDSKVPFPVCCVRDTGY